MDAIPKLLPKDIDERARALRAIKRVLSAQGELSAAGCRRLGRIEKLFNANRSSVAKKQAVGKAPAKRRVTTRKASNSAAGH